MSKEYSYGICPYKKQPNGDIHIILIQPKGHQEWGFIKGKIDKDETIPDCAVRETREETNIIVGVNNLENYFEQKNTRKDIGIFLADVEKINMKKIRLQKSEVHRIKYFDLYRNIDLNKNQRDILEQMREYFRNFRD